MIVLEQLQTWRENIAEDSVRGQQSEIHAQLNRGLPEETSH